MNSRPSGLLLTTVAFVVFAGCSTKYAVPPVGSGDYEYRLAAASGGVGQNTALTVTCWRKLAPSRDSVLEYHRRLSAAGWASAIGGSVLLCGSGAWGWSQGWTALGQYSFGLGIALPVAAPLLARSHGRTKAPKGLTSFRPAVGESLVVENLTASRSCTYVTGTSGKAVLATNNIKDWLAGRNDVSLWVAPKAAQGTRLGINVTSTGTVRQVGLEDMSFEAAESLGTVKAYSDFLHEFPASVKATQAKRVIELLAWKAACAENTRESYREFVKTYPQSESVVAVPRHLERVVLDSAEAVNTAEAYGAFLRAYPSSPFAVDARRDTEKLAWDKAAAMNTAAACDDYLRTHPGSEFAEEAKNLRERIVAEQRMGTLSGEYPNATNIPSGCAMARVVENAEKMLPIVAGDIWTIYPELNAAYTTELQKQVFLSSASAESLRRVLSIRRSEFLKDHYALKLAPAKDVKINDYDVEKGRFEVFLRGDLMNPDWTKDDLRRYDQSARHELSGFWFDQLPLAGMITSYAGLLPGVGQFLDLAVADRAEALELEGMKDGLDIWVVFRLSGRSHAELVETAYPIILIFNRDEGDVVWRSR